MFFKNVLTLSLPLLDFDVRLIIHAFSLYSGTSLLRTLWDQLFLANFCCNIEVFLFQRLKGGGHAKKIF